MLRANSYNLAIEKVHHGRFLYADDDIIISDLPLAY
jgi:hypothetical protein